MSIFNNQSRIDAIVTSIWALEQQAEKQKTLVLENPKTRAGKSALADLTATLQNMLNDIELLSGYEGTCLWQTQKREFVARIRKEFNIQ